MRPFVLTMGSILMASGAFAQSDQGTITGTISDSTGAVVPSAPIQITNTLTGATYNGGSSGTGNYVMGLPTGTYEMTVTVQGFKKYVHPNIVLPVAQTLRLDVSLEVGAATDTITVNAEATLLQTESGEVSHNVSASTLNDLPVLQIGGSSATGVRNPYAVVNLIPGSSNLAADVYVRINGTPSSTQSFKIEGQDAYSGIYTSQSWTQPSVDAIQEMSIQTSNFAAEYGQAGGGVFNVTMRSGTNAFHGSAYEYWGNNILNAGNTFYRRTRRHDRTKPAHSPQKRFWFYGRWPVDHPEGV